jgi:membrane-associated phospholipid phosphatase
MNGNVIQMLPAEGMSFLPAMYLWGIDVIRVIQRIETPVLTALMKFITVLGTEALYVPMVIFIFWWIDEKRGLRLGILVIVSAWINASMKELLKQPRPFNLEPSVGLASESSYGAPSGHAQMSLTFWIPMAAWLSRTWAVKTRTVITDGEKPGLRKLFVWVAAIVFILLIGFTRLYLGVHFPTDLFAGWFLGGIILVLWFVPGPLVEKRLISAGARTQNICVAAIALIMNGLNPHERYLAALFLGFGIGYMVMKKFFPFSARGEINGKSPRIHVMFLRCLMGFAGMAVIYLGLKLILPGEGSIFGSLPGWGQSSPFYELGRFIRYALVGFWASAGAPRIFQRMGLAVNEHTGNRRES